MLDLAVLLDQHTAELSTNYPNFPGNYLVYIPDERGMLISSQKLVYLFIFVFMLHNYKLQMKNS